MTCTIDDYSCNSFGIYYQNVRIAYYYLGFLMLDNTHKDLVPLLKDYGFDTLTFDVKNDKTSNIFKYMIECFIESIKNVDYMNPIIFKICHYAHFQFTDKFFQYCKNLDFSQVVVILNKIKKKKEKKDQQQYQLVNLWYELVH